MVQLARLNLPPNFIRDHFRLLIFTTVIVALSAKSAFAQQKSPYVAYVTKADAYVRSGPGQRYYPTQQLQQGFAVEVYRHDGDHWCAVRPPEGSFSWVAAHQVNQLGQGVAEVSAEQTITRIGSLLSPERSVVQVLLPRGEQVKVLNSTANSDPRWLQVAAPAGEFRWIAAEDLSPQPPVETTTPVKQAGGWSQQSDGAPTVAAQTSQPPSAFGHLSKAPTSLPTNNAAVTDSYIPPSNIDSNAMDVVAGSPAELQLAQFQAQNQQSLPSPIAQAITPTVGQPLAESKSTSRLPSPRIRFHGRSPPQAPITPRVAELELRLSEIIVRSPAEWHFQQVKNEANGLLGTTDSSDERARLREVIERITRFEQVQQRYSMAPVAPPQPSDFASVSPAINAAELQRPAVETPQQEYTGMTATVRERVKRDLAGQGAGDSELASGSDTPLYDAVGMLKPVVSKRGNAPGYALVDEKGEVVSFVTPTPDLNLKPYLGQRIGVHGTRDYMQELRRAHVTASRLTPIEGPIRR